MAMVDDSHKYTTVVTTDEPGQGNACHEYEITDKDGKTLGEVSFQNGPIKEVGVNGVMNEDLIAILISRMKGFQSGDFACVANSHALSHLKNALGALQARTAQREERGVEGTNVV